MGAALLTTASSLQCPHGGKVTIASANAKAKAGVALALATDTFAVVGCAFQISGAPHPCVTVRWIAVNLHASVDGQPGLTEASAGLCLAADQAPQGPVSVISTQPKASGS
jgi:hypothetical protein